MGQNIRRLCHTQEIFYEPASDEWHRVDQRPEQLAQFEDPPRSESVTPLGCRTCCQYAEEIEEVLIVHHEALRKIDFLMKYNEVKKCDSPTLPACINAVKHARIERACADQRRRMPPVSSTSVRDNGTADGGAMGFAAVEQLCAVTRGGTAEDADGIVGQSSHDSADHGDISHELLKHVQTGRQRLLQFLNRMGSGIDVRFVENDSMGSSIDVKLRLIFLQGPLVFSVEGDGLLEYVPLSSVSCVHIGSKEDVFHGENPALCMTLRTRLGWSSSRKQSPGSKVDLTQEQGESFHFVFPSVNVREDFQRGMKLLQQHNVLV